MEMEDNIVRQLLVLERNVLNLLKREDDKKQISREIRNIIETAKTLKGEINLYQLRERDEENYVLKVRELENKIRLLEVNTDEEDEGIVLNIIHDIQTNDDKTFAQLKQIVEEKNIKINQLEQANIDFKAENNRLKLSKFPGYVTKYKTASEVENIIMKLEKKISDLENEYRTTDKSRVDVRKFKQKKIEEEKRKLEHFKNYLAVGYETELFPLEYE